MGGCSILTSALPVRKVTVWVLLHTVFLYSLGREGKGWLSWKASDSHVYHKKYWRKQLMDIYVLGSSPHPSL